MVNKWALLQGMIYCVGASIGLAFLMACYLLFKDTLFVYSISQFIGHFMMVFAYWSIMGFLFSTFCTLLIGIPFVILLNKFGLDKKINITIIGGLIGFILGSIKSILYGSSINTNLSIVFTVYGIVCGFTFMLGYEREVNSSD